jgi:fibrillarin-like pre-rRNA processing protein
MIQAHKFLGVYYEEEKLFTKSLPSAKGKRVYGEKLAHQAQVEYRSWSCYRSKLAATIVSGCKNFPFNQSSSLLYLGAASGTTVSHLSDILVKGIIYAVEVSPSVFLDLLKVSKPRPNIIPILADASKPQSYKAIVANCEVLYQDIAQRNQVEIFIKNAEAFLKSKGYGILIVKARSIDVTSLPSIIFNKIKFKLQEASFEVLESINLEPFHRDHLVVFVKLS